jgi:hypothetical protein
MSESMRRRAGILAGECGACELLIIESLLDKSSGNYKNGRTQGCCGKNRELEKKHLTLAVSPQKDRLIGWTGRSVT